MKKNVNVICPYCGKKVNIEHDSLYNDVHAVVCDVFDGGCDRVFAAYISVSVTAVGKKIEGEEQKEREE